jgi:hypothetical protein
MAKRFWVYIFALMTTSGFLWADIIKSIKKCLLPRPALLRIPKMSHWDMRFSSNEGLIDARFLRSSGCLKILVGDITRNLTGKNHAPAQFVRGVNTVPTGFDAGRRKFRL